MTKKQRVLVGFRERRSAYLADVKRCEVLLPEVGTCLQELAGLVASLDTYHHVPQIEVAAGDDAVALVFRHLQALSEADEAKLAAFARARGFHAYSQSGGPATLRPLGGGHDEMCYRLHAFGVELCFVPTDFTQINAEINRQMVGQAIDWLAPAPHERILDLFCGIGNFTLPIARHGSSVVGVEGERTLVERARRNAAHNAIDNVMFFATDLATELGSEPWAQESFDKAVLDPPRSGAGEVLAVLSGLNVGRIVYVSCNGATLARDAGVLVNDLEYRLSRLGVVDMFPHTTHMEAMALFERPRA